MKYHAVIFDLFGTLVDNFTGTEYNALLDRISGILGTPGEEFRRLWKGSFSERVIGVHQDQRASFEFICRELNVPVTEEQLQEAFTVRFDYTVRSLKPKPDTVPTLKTIREKGYKTALISDCTGEVPLIWDDTPFAPLFDVTVFSCTAGTLKPDPRMYHLAVEPLGVKPEECIYVGDGSSTELTGARAAGMRAVLIRDPGETDDTHYLKREDDWDGDRISYLREVLPILGETGI